MDNGRIFEKGKHQELMEKKSLYYELVMAQQMAREDEDEEEDEVDEMVEEDEDEGVVESRSLALMTKKDKF